MTNENTKGSIKYGNIWYFVCLIFRIELFFIYGLEEKHQLENCGVWQHSWVDMEPSIINTKAIWQVENDIDYFLVDIVNQTIWALTRNFLGQKEPIIFALAHQPRSWISALKSDGCETRIWLRVWPPNWWCIMLPIDVLVNYVVTHY